MPTVAVQFQTKTTEIPAYGNQYFEKIMATRSPYFETAGGFYESM